MRASEELGLCSDYLPLRLAMPIVDPKEFRTFPPATSGSISLDFAGNSKRFSRGFLSQSATCLATRTGSDFDSTAIFTPETHKRTAPPVHRSPVIGNRISPNRENANISTTANVNRMRRTKRDRFSSFIRRPQLRRSLEVRTGSGKQKGARCVPCPCEL